MVLSSNCNEGQHALLNIYLPDNSPVYGYFSRIQLSCFTDKYHDHSKDKLDWPTCPPPQIWAVAWKFWCDYFQRWISCTNHLHNFILNWFLQPFSFFRKLAIFQTRSATRVLVRDRDVLKWLLLILTVLSGYLVAWTVFSVQAMNKCGESIVEIRSADDSVDNMKFYVCALKWWDYVIDVSKYIPTNVEFTVCLWLTWSTSCTTWWYWGRAKHEWIERILKHMQCDYFTFTL